MQTPFHHTGLFFVKQALSLCVCVNVTHPEMQRQHKKFPSGFKNPKLCLFNIYDRKKLNPLHLNKRLSSLKILYFFIIHMKNVTPASNHCVSQREQTHWPKFHPPFSGYIYFVSHKLQLYLTDVLWVQMRYTDTAVSVLLYRTSQASRSVEQHIPQVACYWVTINPAAQQYTEWLKNMPVTAISVGRISGKWWLKAALELPMPSTKALTCGSVKYTLMHTHTSHRRGSEGGIWQSFRCIINSVIFTGLPLTPFLSHNHTSQAH